MEGIKVTPKDFFLHLGSAVGLYVSAISLINLLFSIIAYAFPDNLDYYVDPYSSAVRWGIAILIIFFPIFVWITSIVNKGLSINPAQRGIWIRRWLAYLTLFIAGITVAVDLVVLVNTFLGGEITTRFFLKVLTVLVVAGGVFWYYLSDLRRDSGKQAISGKTFAIGATVLILLSLVAGFLVMGSPATARKMKFDERRVSDLQNVQWQLVNYWQLKQSLPTSLEGLTDPIAGFIAPVDPETGTAYEYSKSGTMSFSLCVTFSLPSSDNGRNAYIAKPAGPYAESNENWQHKEGRQCFERTIDPTLYPPRKN
ncbi:MAG TPA: DUF5671 domain-containing protein [Candidatus Paceibacterota bacterium]